MAKHRRLASRQIKVRVSREHAKMTDLVHFVEHRKRSRKDEDRKTGKQG